MAKIYIVRPEHILFLHTAFELMNKYRETHKKYTNNWPDLEMHFAKGGYYLNDPDIYPTPDTGNKWKPRGCKYTYWIKSATKNSFIIQALNQGNIPEYEIMQDTEYPINKLDKLK